MSNRLARRAERAQKRRTGVRETPVLRLSFRMIHRPPALTDEEVYGVAQIISQAGHRSWVANLTIYEAQKDLEWMITHPPWVAYRLPDGELAYRNTRQQAVRGKQ